MICVCLQDNIHTADCVKDHCQRKGSYATSASDLSDHILLPQDNPILLYARTVQRNTNDQFVLSRCTKTYATDVHSCAV